MIRVILSVFFVLIISYSNGQNFTGGIVAGINAAQIDGDTQGGYKKLGFIAGFFVDYKLTEKSFLKAEFCYSGKGAVKNVKYAGGVVWQEFKTSLHYIEIPVSFSYRIMRQFSLSAGVAPAYLFLDNLYAFGDIIPKETYQMSYIDFGLKGEVEFYFPNNFSIGIAVTRSILSIRKDYFWLNNTLSFTGRYRF